MLFVLGVVWLAAQAANAEEILVITAPETSLSNISIRKLARIYQRKILISSSGMELVPVNLPLDHPLRQSLSLRLFRKRPENMADYWDQKYFQGISPPYVVDSQEAVIRFVSQKSGAIGYIEPCKLDKRVAVILKIQVAKPFHTNECKE